MIRRLISIAPVALLVATSLPAQELTVREVWSTKGDAPYEFIVIAGMAVQPGRILISDSKGEVMLSHDERTGRTHRFARTGKGPGEVLTPTVAATGPDGAAYIYDIRRAGSPSTIPLAGSPAR